MTFAFRAVTASPAACLAAALVVHVLHTALGAPGVEGLEQALLASGLGSRHG